MTNKKDALPWAPCHRSEDTGHIDNSHMGVSGFIDGRFIPEPEARELWEIKQAKDNPMGNAGLVGLLAWAEEETAQLRADNARLRKALEEIYNLCSDDEWDAEVLVFDHIKPIVQEALEHSDKL